VPLQDCILKINGHALPLLLPPAAGWNMTGEVKEPLGSPKWKPRVGDGRLPS